MNSLVNGKSFPLQPFRGFVVKNASRTSAYLYALVTKGKMDIRMLCCVLMVNIENTTFKTNNILA